LLKVKTKSNFKFQHVIENDLVTPTIILILLFLIEHIRYNLNWWYFVCLLLLLSTFSTIYFFRVKNKQWQWIQGKYSKYFWIICSIIILIRFFEFDKIHFFIELIVILLTFVFYSYYKKYKLYLTESDDERNYWESYQNALSEANNKIIAINTSDYEDFLSPSGFRYFTEQIKLINENKNNTNNNNLVLERYFIVSYKNNLKDSMEMQSFNIESNLSDEQRVFKSLAIIHKTLNIKIYLAKRSEVKKFIKEYNKRSGLKLKLKNLDILQIDDKYYSSEEKIGEYIFREVNNDTIKFIHEFKNKYSNKCICYETKKLIDYP
jgi:hypothetical protein